MSVSDIAKKVKCTPALVYNVKARIGGGGGTKAKRAPGRPPKATAVTGLDGLAGILDAVKSTEREKAQLRAALERVQEIVATVLDG